MSFGSRAGSPLRWVVLDASADDYLLLAERVLTAGAFRSDWETATANSYASSDVRHWLQSTFVPTAFSAEQSEALLPHSGGVTGTDHVFLLTAAEVQRYLTTKTSRRARPLDQAAAELGYSGEPLSLANGYAGWWLADPAASGAARYVRADGTLASEPVYYADLGVRPAIRVDRHLFSLGLASKGVR